MENRRAVSRKFASTRGVIGRVWMACLTASIRMRLFAMAGVMVKGGGEAGALFRSQLGLSHHREQCRYFAVIMRLLYR